MGKHKNLIHDIINRSCQHLTAEEIYLQAKKVRPTIAMGTVYRNLGLLTQAGKIKRLNMPCGADRYDKTLSPHEHLICEKCGELSDISIKNLQNYLEEHTGIQVLEYELKITYVCKKCEKEESG